MRRSPMPPRSKPMARVGIPRRRDRLKPMSAKRRTENRKRRELAAPLGQEPCAVRLDGCTGWAEHWHELIGAGVGGSRIDPRNISPVCDRCNSAIEDLDDRYERLLKVRSVLGVKGRGGLVPRFRHPLSLAQRDEWGEA